MYFIPLTSVRFILNKNYYNQVMGVTSALSALHCSVLSRYGLYLLRSFLTFPISFWCPKVY